MNEKRINEDRARDTGLAMVLICLLVLLFAGGRGWLWAAIVLLGATMTWPMLFRPLARFWFGLSHHLGNIVSKIILTLLYALILVPVALVRRMMGKDSLLLKARGGKVGSAFIVRDQSFSAADLERPY